MKPVPKISPLARRPINYWGVFCFVVLLTTVAYAVLTAS
jgi:hypothetical protein